MLELGAIGMLDRATDHEARHVATPDKTLNPAHRAVDQHPMVCPLQVMQPQASLNVGMRKPASVRGWPKPCALAIPVERQAFGRSVETQAPDLFLATGVAHREHRQSVSRERRSARPTAMWQRQAKRLVDALLHDEQLASRVKQDSIARSVSSGSGEIAHRMFDPTLFQVVKGTA